MAVLTLIPRFALEAITFGGMLLVVLYLMMLSGNLTTALPIIALYAFAGYRLMPATRYLCDVSQLRYISPSIDLRMMML